jgi:hypothetical protein
MEAPMRKFLTTALAAVTFGGAVAATAVPAEARDYYRGYYGHHHHGSNDVGVAAVAGIAGLALGAALSSSGSRGSRGYSSSYGYSNYGYSNGYRYDPRDDSYDGDYYARPERICISQERVWDPYIGRHVRIERRYPC